MQSIGWRDVLGYLLMAGGFAIGFNGASTFAKSRTDEMMSRGTWDFIDGCVVMAVGILLFRAARARRIDQLVANLNPLPGKSLSRIRRKLGEPQVTEELPGGEIVRTWRLPGRNLSLAFSPQDVCTRVAREEVTAV